MVLDRDWLFHPGDDVTFSAPGLDDRGWLRIDLKRGMHSYGFDGLKYGWLRLHIHLPANSKGMVFATGRTLGRYQVFANGVRIGSLGDMSRHDLYDKAYITQFPLPPSVFAAGGDGDLVIALRCSLQFAQYSQRGPQSPFQLGAAYVGTSGSLTDKETAGSTLNFAPYAINSVPSFLTGLVALALFLSLRTRREYLYLAAYAFADSGYSVQQVLSWVLPFGLPAVVWAWIVGSIMGVMLFEFVRETLGLRRKTWMLLAEFLPCFGILPALPWAEGYLSYSVNSLAALTLVFELVAICFVLLGAARKRSLDAVLLFAGVFPLAVAQMYDGVRELSGNTLPAYVHLGPFRFEGDTLGDILLEVALLVFLINRTVRIARERNRAASELEAARTVQQVLVPEAIPEVEGLAIATAYLPAQEVGGDFFQVLPLASGSMLLVIGDVAGKGMQAAMTVSLLVGALRTLVEVTDSPGRVLEGLNRRLQGRGIGFTTCLALLFSSDRRVVTVANAGHPRPYRNGVEVETEASLPLGLDGDAVFDEQLLELDAGDHLTMLTDGVPEAMHLRKLFGFERTAEMSRESAGSIAEAAQSFGQTDDITVLTVDVLRPA